MKWIHNLLQYSDTGKTGKCPICGSADVKVEEHRFETRRSVTFCCRACKATEHFDGFSDDKGNRKGKN